MSQPIFEWELASAREAEQSAGVLKLHVPERALLAGALREYAEYRDGEMLVDRLSSELGFDWDWAYGTDVVEAGLGREHADVNEFEVRKVDAALWCRKLADELWQTGRFDPRDPRTRFVMTEVITEAGWEIHDDGWFGPFEELHRALDAVVEVEQETFAFDRRQAQVTRHSPSESVPAAGYGPSAPRIG